MKSLQRLRQRLGLTQEEMAQLLGASRTACAMAETIGRPLPSAASLRLTQLELLIEGPEMPVTLQLPAHLNQQFDNSRRKCFDKAAEEHSFQLLAGERRLKEMKDRFAACVTLLQVLDLLRRQPLPTRDARIQELWIAVTEADTINKLQDCSIEKQELLQWELQYHQWMLQQLKA